MYDQTTEFLDARSREKMKRAKKFEKRIKNKKTRKITNFYSTKKGGRVNV
jgi:regulator of sigma D